MDESLNLSVNNRKIRKPLMERKRRARINKSLNELQEILTESDLTPKGTKLEKADILEMTVRYLNNLRQNQYSKEDKENLENLMLEQYLLGFEKCSKEVEKYVTDVSEVDTILRHKLNSYLTSCLASIKKQPACYSSHNQKHDSAQFESSCSVLLQGPTEFRILPSRLASGEMVLLVSSDLSKCEGLRKSDMWRPW